MPFVINIDPVALTIVGFPVLWHQLTLVVSAGVAIWLAEREALRRGIGPEIVPEAQWIGLGIAVVAAAALIPAQQGEHAIQSNSLQLEVTRP